MKKPLYLNGHRREIALWICSLQLILEDHRAHFKNKMERTWLESIIYSIEVLSKLMLGGIDKTELRAIDNAIKLIQPTLYASKIVKSEGKTQPVSVDLIYDLAESAVDNCRWDCKQDWDNCPRRKMFLELLIPPYTLEGPCQYYQEEVKE